ncbi:hypothetical protein M407DRAFT_29111 [Tulasnella calospora MUT 4182]|uniref:Uncharacterized protein n=1 Tax=Tulasnella calospora MUT 4182 TaxID=1051891 RepID=A0A0C3Q050_9AGAM|nr:hypothetical protein M407DRAFT_29111 [Tulasnella calospora MUT 4182]
MRLVGPHILRCNSFRIRVSSGYESYDWICRNFQGYPIPRLVIESADGSLKQVSIPRKAENVCLENISIPWKPSSFPKLLSLQITGLTGQSYVYPWERPSAFSAVMAVLTACPCLQALKLDRFKDELPTYFDETLLQNERTSFPSLESLEMRGSRGDMFWQVLDIMEFPNLSKLFIYPTHPNPSPERMTDAVCKDIGGRSLLQSIIDRANCERLIIYIRRGPSAMIRLRGMNDTGKVIDFDPLTRDSSTNTVLKVLKAIESPVHIEISGEMDDSFIRSLRETSMIASLYHPPHSQESGGSKVAR